MFDINSYLKNLSLHIEEQLKKLEEKQDIEYVENIHKEILKLEAIFVKELGFNEQSSAIDFINIINQLCTKYKSIILQKKKSEYLQKIIDLMRYLITNDMEYCCDNGMSEMTRYRLSIVAIVRNEKDIIEWIEYHRIVGVEHFYIYDNESTDGLKEKLKYYIDKGIVTYTYFPGDKVQMKAYEHAIENYKYDTKWLAIIDGDEFIVPVENVLLSDLCDNIEQIYAHTQDAMGHVGGIVVNWRVYGTSYHKTRIHGLCIENYTKRRNGKRGSNAIIKTIVNPRVVTLVDNHCCEYKKNYYSISENGTVILGALFFEGDCSKIRINHYHSKSEEELLEKLKRGWPDQEHVELQKYSIDNFMKISIEEENEIEDFIMARYVEEVKKRVNIYQERGFNGNS